MKYGVSMMKKMSLKNKLVISFIILIILPIAVLGYFSVRIYSNEIEDKVLKSAFSNNEQIMNHLDNHLKILGKLSEYPLNEEKLLEILRKDYSRLSNEKYIRYTDFVDAKSLLFNNIVFYSDLIDSVWLYGMDDYDLRARAMVESMNADYNIHHEPWLKTIKEKEGGLAIIGVHHDKQKMPGTNYVVSIGRMMIDPNSYSRTEIGIIIINIDIKKLEKLWVDSGITPNTLFYLIDEKDHIIYSRDHSQIHQNIHHIWGQELNFESLSGQEICLGDKRYQFISCQSGFSMWRMISIIPSNELFSYREQMIPITLFVGIVLIVLTVLSAFLITNSITRPIYELSHRMENIGEGNFDVSIGMYYGEIGIISKTISLMQKKIKNLIQKIYVEEEEKRKAEMHALQAQINPHFLYNTMSAIKWMANIQGASGIEEALNSLAFLLAYTSKWDHDFVGISDEMVFVENYIHILEIRFYNMFTVYYNIQKEVYRYKTLKFLLQPIIENAVLHGFEGLEKHGDLNICIRKEGNNIIFCVTDNGKGFDQNILPFILETKQEPSKQRFNSIGLSNVHRRIQLHFGKQYGLSVQSEEKKGTRVTIVIPAMGMQSGSEGVGYEDTHCR